jgi:hypothetical protein
MMSKHTKKAGTLRVNSAKTLIQRAKLETPNFEEHYDTPHL